METHAGSSRGHVQGSHRDTHRVLTGTHAGSSRRLTQGPHRGTHRVLMKTHTGSSQGHIQGKLSELGSVVPFFVTSPCQRSIFFFTRSDLAVKHLD